MGSRHSEAVPSAAPPSLPTENSEPHPASHGTGRLVPRLRGASVTAAGRALGPRLLRSRPMIAVLDPSPGTLASLDLVLGLAVIYFAMTLRFDDLAPFGPIARYVPGILLPAAVRPIVNHATGLYGYSWRHASLRELGKLVASVVVGTIVCATIFYAAFGPLGIADTSSFPRSFWFIEALLNVTLIGGSRIVIRIHHQFRTAPTRFDARGVPTILYGAGAAGTQIARSALREPRAGVLPVGFIDDDARLKGQFVTGLRVFGGFQDLDEAVEATGAKQVLVTMPTAPGAAIRRILEAATKRNLTVRTLPALTDLLDGSIDIHRVRSVRVEDLLRRPVVASAGEASTRLIRASHVLVSGAAGSIGSELSRQLSIMGPAKLVLLDRSESALYEIERELAPRLPDEAGDAPGNRMQALLADITSEKRLHQLLLQHNPNVVFHAAALKHVPMMESHPCDAVLVNVGGTANLLSASIASGVERFVLISTDKAVEPTSVMGATKRVAELLVRQAAQSSGRAYVSVRFGNVLGSSGSVMRLFQAQLERGAPITVTHPDMTRYFMTIPEAARLVLAATSIGSPSDSFVLEMGEPVRIMDLAEEFLRLAGRDPDSVPIEVIGPRPGEKIAEQLFYRHEEVEKTVVPGVLRMRRQHLPPPDLDAQVRELLALARDYQDGAVRARLFDIVRQCE